MDLDILFSEEEVYNAMHQCCDDKALRPNDMTMAFIQDDQDTLKVDLERMLTKFHSTGKFVKSLNATFIGLIPKKPGAHDIKDYCSINSVRYV